MMSLQSVLLALFVVLAAICSSSSFSSCAFVSRSATSGTTLNMGLFDGFQQKPKPKKEAVKQDQSVFAGRGNKVTIREDEDNAMWVEDPKDKKKGK